MPIYVYKCGCGTRVERLMPLDAPAPGCPACGGETRKIPAGFSLGGQADAGLSKERMPQTWRGTYHGDREYLTGLQRQWEKRQRLEGTPPRDRGRPAADHRPRRALPRRAAAGGRPDPRRRRRLGARPRPWARGPRRCCGRRRGWPCTGVTDITDADPARVASEAGVRRRMIR